MSAKKGQYARPVAAGMEVMVLLMSTFGGMGPELVQLIKMAAFDRQNRLRGWEFDATSWAARTWTSFTVQKLSCALMRAVAWELTTELGMSRVRDTRDD